MWKTSVVTEIVQFFDNSYGCRCFRGLAGDVIYNFSQVAATMEKQIHATVMQRTNWSKMAGFVKATQASNKRTDRRTNN